MAQRIQKQESVTRVAKRMATSEKAAEKYVDAFLDTLYEAFKAGESVTLPGFGGFYLQPRAPTWIFKFNPGQKLRTLFGWSSTYKDNL